jgi:hypothetical protein
MAISRRRSDPAFLLQQLPELKDPLTRGAAWVTLYCDVDGAPARFHGLAMRDAAKTRNECPACSERQDAFWTFFPMLNDVSSHRNSSECADLASTRGLDDESPLLRCSMVTTPEGVVLKAGQRRHSPRLVCRTDEAGMALDLAVRWLDAASILDEQRNRR